MCWQAKTKHPPMEMHVIVLLYTDSVENILKLQKMIMACKVQYLAVRTKIDMISGDAYRRDLQSLKSFDGNAALAFTSSTTKERFYELHEAVLQMHSGVGWRS